MEAAARTAEANGGVSASGKVEPLSANAKVVVAVKPACPRIQICVLIINLLNMEREDVTNNKKPVQRVLPVVETGEGRDRDYDHLVAHLFPVEEEEGKCHH